ncbi:MAG TPA: hypothetical protein VFZ53_10430 [Polyangiaceae bacterium]
MTNARAGEPVRFEYHAPSGCPDETAFVERVLERSLEQRLATGGELARTFVVTVAVDERGATARVDFVDADGSKAFRKVRGSTCEEAVSGIALVCALALDGRAVPDDPSAPAAPVDASVAAPPSAPTPPQTPPAQPSNTARAAAQPTRIASTLAFSVGAGAAYASHKGPSGAPVVDVFFDARLAALGPSARASAWHSWRDSTTSGGREARFRGYGLRLEVCPLAFGSSVLFAEPCLATDAGVLLASAVESSAVPEPQSSTEPWWDVVAVARIGSVVSGFLLFEGQGELAVPLVAHRYGFGEPPVEPAVFDVPAVGLSARVGMGFRFR